MKIYRHGDCLLKQSQRPKNLKLVGEYQSFVLAEGEQTGHSHLLTINKPLKSKSERYSIKVYEDEKNQRYIELNEKAVLTHEEHKEITIEPDFYVFGIEQEYNYEDMEMQKVID